MEVKILSTGVANVASVIAAFQRLKCRTSLVTDADTIENTDFLVLPGVGSFGAGMDSLREKSLVTVLQNRIAAQRPTLAICLGLQLLATTSEESPGVQGLRCIPNQVEAFPETVRRPQFGWNWLSNENTSVLGDGGYVYYANSFRITESPSGWTLDGRNTVLMSAVYKKAPWWPVNSTLNSKAYGAQVLSRWLEAGRAANIDVKSDPLPGRSKWPGGERRSISGLERRRCPVECAALRLGRGR